MTKEQMKSMIFAILVGNHRGELGEGLAAEYKRKAEYLAGLYFLEVKQK